MFSEIPGHLKVIARDISVSAISDTKLYFLTCSRHLVGMQQSKERNLKSVQDWIVLCVYL